MFVEDIQDLEIIRFFACMVENLVKTPNNNIY